MITTEDYKLLGEFDTKITNTLNQEDKLLFIGVRNLLWSYVYKELKEETINGIN